ncbi:MAG: GtrA family protein [Spirochaetaceae bacterium]|nr:MAG: GtrA family protein [Spirochaetaceae bacterium]
MLRRLTLKMLVHRTRHPMVQIFRSLLGSFGATLIDYGVLLMLIEVIRMNEVSAGSISMLAGLTFAYLAGRYWVFPAVPRGYRRIEFACFTIIASAGIALHVGILWYATYRLNLHYLAAKAIALSLVFCWNFTARRLVHSILITLQARANARCGRPHTEH